MLSPAWRPGPSTIHPALVTSFLSFRPKSGFFEQMKYLRYVLVVGFFLFVLGWVFLTSSGSIGISYRLFFICGFADIVFIFFIFNCITKDRKKKKKKSEQRWLPCPLGQQETS